MHASAADGEDGRSVWQHVRRDGLFEFGDVYLGINIGFRWAPSGIEREGCTYMQGVVGAPGSVFL